MNRSSIVEYFYKERVGRTCGYCHSNDGYYSHGMWGHVLTCQDYQDLIDRGWRRSGRYCYKPTMNRTCCPAYTIRCDATQFHLSKSQKKVLKTFRNYIIKDDAKKKNNQDAAKEFEASKADVKPGLGADPSKPKSRKKKDNKKEKAKLKGIETGDNIITESRTTDDKTLEDLTSLEFPPDSQHTFEVRLVKAQTSDSIFSESCMDSYQVYKKYQMAIHHDSPSDCSLSQFKRFLCNSSLVADDPNLTGGGAFHQQYIIDGRIVAVGVIDILPHCVSSVYLYYDPDFAFLSLGTLTALFEIAFTRKLNRDLAALKFYYMGYYIHSCSKMRYKSKYQPSWLLCPKSNQWVPVDEALPLLDQSKYSILNKNAGTEAEQNPSHSELGILFDQQAITYKMYKSLCTVDKEEQLEIGEYANLVGGALSERLLLYRH